MPATDLFHRYYDLLFSRKDYRQETELLFDIARKNGITEIDHLLEIGCGTGNHSFELARNNVQITAVDTDPEMIAIAKEKQYKNQGENIDFFLGDIDQLEKNNFQVALAMFNVVTYIGEVDELIRFMTAISERLQKGGVFIFDCWNGLAALLDPPGSKTTEGNDGGDKIYCELTSSTDIFNQRTELTYSFTRTNVHEEVVEQGSHSFMQYLWTPNQIKYAIQNAGLELLHCTRNFEPDLPATESDWKIMFVCRKS